MSQPPVPLGPEQQRGLFGRLIQAVTAAVEPGWRQLRVDYRAMGRHVEADLVVTGADGNPELVAPPPQVVQLLAELRAGMYEPGRGTWFGVGLVVLPSAPPQVEYWFEDEPSWRRRPPRQGYQDEARFFPRAEHNVPGWLRRAAAEDGSEPGTEPATPPAGPAEPAVPRLPKVYDGLDGAGRPVVNRPPLDFAEKERVLAYFEAAPVVLAARSFEVDAFDPEREPLVPLTFRTDGTWVWPGAVAYYLREHDVAPDTDLLAHVRARDYTLPRVSEEARGRAVAAVTEQPTANS